MQYIEALQQCGEPQRVQENRLVALERRKEINDNWTLDIELKIQSGYPCEDTGGDCRVVPLLLPPLNTLLEVRYVVHGFELVAADDLLR